jgi:hypothetical protein
MNKRQKKKLIKKSYNRVSMKIKRGQRTLYKSVYTGFAGIRFICKKCQKYHRIYGDYNPIIGVTFPIHKSVYLRFENKN